MNINFDDIVTIFIHHKVDIKTLEIHYIRPYRRPSAFSNQHEKTDSKAAGHSRSRVEKPNSSKGDLSSKSNSTSNMTSVASKVSPPALSPSRPQQTFFFGQNPEAVNDDNSERKQSAVDKVRTIPYPIHMILIGYIRISFFYFILISFQ